MQIEDRAEQFLSRTKLGSLPNQRPEGATAVLVEASWTIVPNDGVI